MLINFKNEYLNIKLIVNTYISIVDNEMIEKDNHFITLEYTNNQYLYKLDVGHLIGLPTLTSRGKSRTDKWFKEISIDEEEIIKSNFLKKLIKELTNDYLKILKKENELKEMKEIFYHQKKIKIKKNCFMK
jgi:hypothetical protein